MIAIRIGPDFRFAVVGLSAYIKRPKAAQDACGPRRSRLHQPVLADLRRPLRLGIRARVRVSSQLTFRTLTAALDVFGPAYVVQDLPA
jgi:hypothetical protein